MDETTKFPPGTVECRRDRPDRLQHYRIDPAMFHVVMALSVMSGGPYFTPDDPDLPAEAQGRYLDDTEARELADALRRYLDGTTLQALGRGLRRLADPASLPHAIRQGIADFMGFCGQGAFAMRRIPQEVDAPE